ncbi:MAG: restriction endonuclease [Anaerolineae bacterium]|nr:restriction endonuclease [Anaerolineae bacterium]
MTIIDNNHLQEALTLIKLLGLPNAQQNERSALSLLALVNLTPEKTWSQIERPLIGITPIMEWIEQYYSKKYAPNSRETIRRFTMHQFVDAGIAIVNPDDPERATNSPHFVYQIEKETFDLLQSYASEKWAQKLAVYFEKREKLIDRYAKRRKANKIPVKTSQNQQVLLTPGKHNILIKAIVEEFAPRFLPDSIVIHIGDTGDKWAFYDENLLIGLGVKVNLHGKMPDVILYDPHRNWLVLVESVTSHGPVDSKRHEELNHLFAKATADLVFVTAFLDRATMSRYLSQISWETEVWLADSPTHLIHFNGDKFLGPHH